MYSSIFCISGPSGSGQDSIIEALRTKLPLERLITTTTRQMRESESQGKPYYFIDKPSFQQRIQNGDFIEYAQQYNGEYYGVSKQELDRVAQSGKIGIWKVDYQGVMTIKKLFPEIRTILITVSSLETLAERIRNRDNVSEEFVQDRMKYTREFMHHVDIYDYTILNDNGQLQTSVEKIYSIIHNTLKDRNLSSIAK